MRPCPRPVPLALPSSCILGHALRALLRKEKYTQKKEPLFAWKTILLFRDQPTSSPPAPPNTKLSVKDAAGAYAWKTCFRASQFHSHIYFNIVLGGWGYKGKLAFEWHYLFFMQTMVEDFGVFIYLVRAKNYDIFCNNDIETTLSPM